MIDPIHFRYRPRTCLLGPWSAAALAACILGVHEARACQPEGDGLAIVQTGLRVGLQRDPDLAASDGPVPAKNGSADARDVHVDWNLGVFALRRIEDEGDTTLVDGEPVVSSQQKSKSKKHPPVLHRWGRFCQMVPVVVMVSIIAIKGHGLYSTRRQQVDMKKAVELLTAMGFYLLSGPAVIILNKRIMSQHSFHFPIVLASLGQLLLMVVTRGSVRLGLWTVEAKEMSWRRYFKVVITLKVFNLGAQVTGMWAYMFVSVPEVEVLKSVTVALTMILAATFVREPVNLLIVTSVLVIVAGTAIAAAFDKDDIPLINGKVGAHAFGLALCVLSCAFEASKTVCSQILMDSLNVFDGVYWSSPAFVFIAAILVASIELRSLINHTFTPELISMLVLNSILTGLTVLASFWFVKLVGALSLKVVAQARTVGLILISVFFFHEHCAPLTYVGYAVSLVGVGMFNQAKVALASMASKDKDLQLSCEGLDSKKKIQS